ncbi:hypothetical protein KIPB_006712 [Kipferlia bialata]|uniref:Uncharacterized protein n=1 Tax=Kipferlia bialata TaxID=797122 RepID=A0A9K3GJF9_9EUKA|nr:hypothetical protein KIPB_006712 [Kipferlia bialata]|eukprot:g6712.t1
MSEKRASYDILRPQTLLYPPARLVVPCNPSEQMPAPSSYPKFTVTTPGGVEIDVPFGTRYGELLKREEYPAHADGLPPLAVKVNGAIQPLARRVDINCTLEPVYGDSKHGADVYRKSLSYIVPIAARRVFPGRRMIISHSLGHCYFFYFEDKVALTTEQTESLRNEVKAIVAEDTPIDCKKISQPEAQAYFKKHGMLQTLELLQQTNNSLSYLPQYEPGVCGCTRCAWDYGLGYCNGECVHGEGCYHVPGPTNTTCGCATCGWTDSHHNECTGDCQNVNICRQISQNSPCLCSSQNCLYDYAQQKCSGKCPVGQMCVQRGPETCFCERY